METTAINLAGTVATVVLSLLGSLLFIIKLIVPWMKQKIDTKNGSIAELVQETKVLAGEISRLAQAICAQVEASSARQEALLGEAQAVCDRYTQQIDKLVERIEEALGKAA